MLCRTLFVLCRYCKDFLIQSEVKHLNLSISVTTQFCKEWSKTMLSGDVKNAVFLRQVIENYKLKVQCSVSLLVSFSSQHAVQPGKPWKSRLIHLFPLLNQGEIPPTPPPPHFSGQEMIDQRVKIFQNLPGQHAAEPLVGKKLVCKLFLSAPPPPMSLSFRPPCFN